MPRLTERSSRAEGSRGAGSIPNFPNFTPQLASVPGAQETNALIQQWNDQMKRRWVLLDEDLSKRFSITAGFNDGLLSLEAMIEEEQTVRADADSALATSISVVSASVGTLTASVSVLSSALATANNYLESRWTVSVSAGPIVTGVTLYSASGPDTDVSYIAFQADRFQINTASGGNKQLFSATATAVKLGDVLTVDLAAAKVYIGNGTYADASTYWYVDTASGGRMSLGNKFTWDGSALTLTGTITASAGFIGGWVIGSTFLTDAAGVVGMSSAVSGFGDIRFWAGNVTASSASFRVTKEGAVTATSGTIGGWTLSSTTLSASNVIINSAGTITLGTANDILIMSAADATYRMWAGNATAGSASFSVTKAGALFSTSGTIGGFTITSNTLTAGAGLAYILLSSTGSVQVGDPTGLTSAIDPAQIAIGNTNGFTTWRVLDLGTSTIMEMWNATGTSAILFTANTGTIACNNSGGTATISLQGSTGIISSSGLIATSSVLLSGAGSASNPSHSFSGNTGYGMYQSGTNLLFATGGTLRGYFDNSGNFVLGSGTVTAVSFSGSGASLTSLNASNLSSGTVAPARLGSGSGGATKFLREDSTFQTIAGGGDMLGANNLSELTNTGTARSTLGLGSAAVLNTGSMGNLTVGVLASSAGDGYTPLMSDGDNNLSFKFDSGTLSVRVDATVYTVTIT